MFINQLRQNAIAAAQGRKMGTSLRRFAESHEAARVRPANFAQKSKSSFRVTTTHSSYHGLCPVFGTRHGRKHRWR